MPSFRAGTHFRLFLLSLVGAAASCGAAARAPGLDSPPDTLELPETRAAGRPVPPADAGAYRMDAAALRRFATLEEALEALPGFRVRRQGGLGGYSELSFRGARAAQVDIYVDGVRLNQDGDAAPDLAKWPLLWFTSLEARTGFDAAGAGTLARIDLSTRDDSRVNLQGRAGSFSSAEAAFSAQAPVPGTGGWTLSVGAQGQSARNDYPYFNNNETIYNPEDDRVDAMDNNAYASRGARAALRREEAASRHTVSVLWLDSRKEYPGLFPSTARAYCRRSDWLGAWRLERFDGPVSWETGVQARRFEDSYRDPGQSLGYLSYESARASTSGEADARLRARIGPRVEGRLDARLRAEETKPVVTPYSARYASPEAARGEAQGGASLSARLAARLTATAEARQSFARFRADGMRPFPDTGPGRIASADYHTRALRGSLQWARDASPFRQTVAFSARLEQRAPTSGELLGDNLGILSKLDLRPEEARALSATHTLAGSPRALGATPSFQSTVFWNEYRDPIRLKAHGASSFMRYENDADYRSVGFESLASLSARLAEGSVSVTLQDASILNGAYEGDRPAYQSPLEAHAELFAKPPLIPGGHARAGLLADFRGAYYPADANIPASRRAAEWELGAHASLSRGPVRVAADARNLTDRRYRDFAYSPRSGRGYSLFVSFNL